MLTLLAILGSSLGLDIVWTRSRPKRVGPEPRSGRTKGATRSPSASSPPPTVPVPRTGGPGRIGRTGGVRDGPAATRQSRDRGRRVDVADDLRHGGQPREVGPPVADQMEEGRRRLVLTV